MTLTAAALFSASLTPTAHAQLTPVQPIRSAPRPLAGSASRPSDSAAASSGNTTLRWQSSSQVAPPVAKAAPVVARAAYLQDDGALPPRTARAPAADPFLDPFNDGAVAQPATRPRPERLSVPRGESRFIGELAPPDTGSAAEEAPADDFGMELPEESAADRQPQIPNPFSPGEATEGRFSVPSPSDQQSVVQDPAGGELRDRNDLAVDSVRRPSQRTEPSCDELRERIARRTIRKVTLDISPPFRPDILEQDEYAELRAEFIESQQVRQWRSLDGRLLGSGRLIDMAYENAIIETEDGQELSLPMSDLSEPDLEYVTSAWGLPRECQLPQIAFQPRQWLPTKMTWKASELCHKPLYFEEVNLERYGHTAGPFAQPVISTAHFFFNIAVLPYKMGIHPPNECQYALGYYRPGNCAPWIVPPVPLSLRGAVAQTAFVGGMVALIP